MQHKIVLIFFCLLIVTTSSLFAQAATKRFPRDAEYDKVLMQVFEYSEKKNYKKATELLTTLHKTFPKDVPVLLIRGVFYEKQREFNKAAEDWSDVLELSKTRKRTSDAYFSRAVCYFNVLEFDKSVKDFDSYVELNKQEEPHLWQRGIAQYYAKKYSAGRKQFEIHQKVNGNDVENAVWHFLCVAKQKGIKEAQQKLIPIQKDRRLPLMKAHELFAEKATVADVLKRATEELPQDKKQAATTLKRQMFYAHLYIGLYYEAHSKPKLANKHLQLAATKYFLPGYMGNVAKVHVQVYDKQKKTTSKKTR